MGQGSRRTAIETAWVLGCTLVLACGPSKSGAPEGAAGVGGAAGAADGAAGRSPTDAAPTDTAKDAPKDAGPKDLATMEAAPGCRPDGAWDVSVPEGGSCAIEVDDTDRDGVRDCADGCPYDPLKVAKGACGCNVADVDSDGDGVADCVDQCPHDPHNTMAGQCGCVGEPGLVAKGTPCSDPSCPQPGATCDGAGVCGDRSACAPCPNGVFVADGSGGLYWFCGGGLPSLITPSCAVENVGRDAPAARAAAQSQCAAKGLSLVRIQSISEDFFLASLLTGLTWIGANDLDTPGQWYWSSSKSNSGALFWSGGADGRQENSLFSTWASGSPGAASCAAIRPSDARWLDTDCNTPLPYICGYHQGLPNQ